MTGLSSPPRFTARDALVAVVMNLMWGINIIAIKEGINQIEPLTAAWLRQAMVLAVCAPMLRLVPGKTRDLMLLAGLSGFLFYVFTNLSVAASSNVGALAIAGQLGAPFSLILAVLFLGERIHWIRIGGMVLAFAGVVLLVFDPAAVDQHLALALTAAASLVWAVCSLIHRRLAGVPVLTIYAWVGLGGTLLLAPLCLWLEPDQMRAMPMIPLSAFGWVLFSALGSTVIGQGAMSLLLRRHAVSTVVPLTLASPVIAIIGSTIWFKTPLTPMMITGGLIVMAGIAIVTVRTAQAHETGQAGQ